MNNSCAVDRNNRCVTVVGNNKLRGGIPTDRSYAFDDGTASFGVVSDGTKNGRNIRGGIGAEIAVRVLKKILSDVSCIYPELDAAKEDGASLKDRVCERLIREWRLAVLDHASEHPFTDDEYVRMGVSLLTVGRFDTAKAYDCSVCAAMACEDYVLTVRSGNGSIIRLSDSGVGTAEPAEVGKSTSSLASLDADTELASTLERLNGTYALVTVTNGLRSAFADDGEMIRAITEQVEAFLKHGDRGGIASAAQSLAETAAQSPTGDDLSAAYVLIPKPEKH